ncbi:MAG: M36 family metallopeptidase [Archangium sp.]
MAVTLNACAPSALDGKRVQSTTIGTTLTPASASAKLDVIAGYLGRSNADLRAEERVGVDGLVHVRVTQEVGGVRVYGAEARATVKATGELVHVVDALAPFGGRIGAPVLPAREALRAAMLHHGYDASVLTLSSVAGQVTTFDATSDLSEPSTVERVAYVDALGVVQGGFLVQTWSADNLLHHTLISDSGAVVKTELRTNNDAYNVFTEDPTKGPQTVVQGPGAGNAQSPSGWLAGAQSTANIVGNNVNAYLDADGNNRVDRGGVAVTNGQFLTAVDFSAAPSTTNNKTVAVQNLFFLNNVIHDTLYRHGFTEAAGNFQTNNFGHGGSGNDPVQAEAQDGSGTDNANFSTPADGQKPRMQMYLWTGTGPTHELIIGGVSYGAMGAEFGPALTTTGVNGALALANDGVGTTSDACEAIVGSLSGKLALVDRGTCAFTVKAQNVAAAGAVAMIIVNNTGTNDIFGMAGTDKRQKMPSIMIGASDGAIAKGKLGQSGNARKKAQQPLQLDGDIDADIVFHEYGHGLTWRMIGGMSGPLAGAIGEGASDVNAFLNNGDDLVGEYVYLGGIRRYRYAGYPLTYGQANSGEVHNDGEIYAAAMWRVRELFIADGRSLETLYDLFVDGMNYTPATPAFEDMRDGMLQSDALHGGADRCRIWKGFAQFGIGQGANGAVSGSTVTITESFTVPSDCP